MSRHRRGTRSCPCPDRLGQFKRGIELRGLAESLDEGLELIHRTLRIALDKPCIGVLRFVAGGFLREALLGHRILQPLHPGIVFAEAAGHLQIPAKRMAQRRGGRELLVGHGPVDGRTIVRLLAVQDFHRETRPGTPQCLLQHLHDGKIDADEAIAGLGLLCHSGVGRGGGESGVEAQEGAIGDLDVDLHPHQGDSLQLPADGFPGFRSELAHVEHVVLEHPAAEQAEPGKRCAGGGAEVSAGELQRGQQRLVAAFWSFLLEPGQERDEVGPDGFGREGAQVRADELERERVVGQVVQQGIELARTNRGSLRVRPSRLRMCESSQRLSARARPAQLVPTGAGQAGVAGPTGDEQAAPAFSGGQVAEQLGEAAALVVGVGVGEGAGLVVELRQVLLKLSQTMSTSCCWNSSMTRRCCSVAGSCSKFGPAR